MNTEIQSRARRIIRQIEFRLDHDLTNSLFEGPIAKVTDRNGTAVRKSLVAMVLGSLQFCS
jgi:hypothetical protein